MEDDSRPHLYHPRYGPSHCHHNDHHAEAREEVTRSLRGRCNTRGRSHQYSPCCPCFWNPRATCRQVRFTSRSRREVRWSEEYCYWDSNVLYFLRHLCRRRVGILVWREATCKWNNHRSWYRHHVSPFPILY